MFIRWLKEHSASSSLQRSESLFLQSSVKSGNDKIGGLGPGGLDSDWIPENEMDWDS